MSATGKLRESGRNANRVREGMSTNRRERERLLVWETMMDGVAETWSFNWRGRAEELTVVGVTAVRLRSTRNGRLLERRE